MKQIMIKCVLPGLLCLFAISCNDLLDKQVDTSIKREQILNDPSLMGGLLVNAYNYLPRNNSSFNCIDGAMLDCATDDGVDASTSSNIQNMINGAWSPTKIIDDKWSYLYTGVRVCANFFDCIDDSNVSNEEILDANGIPTEESKLKERYKAEGKVILAFLYTELIKYYGDVPLVTTLLDPDPSELNLPRTSYDEIVEEIVKWCDEAAEVLPLVYVDATKGRMTKGAALMVKSRALLYAASPLHNPSNDNNKWTRAAAAAKAVIDLNTGNNLYTLNNDFSAPFSTQFDKEIILPGKYSKRNDIEMSNVPTGYDRGNGRTNPTQNLVDAFEILEGGVYVPYDPAKQEHIDQMYSANRDPRLAKTVLYNGVTFKGRSVETYVGGLDGLNLRQGYTRSGYYLRKFLVESIDLNDSNSGLQRAWIMFRYPEALLNYAEAQNEALITPDQSVYDMLNMVRKRSMGAAGVIPEGSLDKEQMRARIRNERRVEFAFEEHRFWDLRRWNVGSEYLGKPVYGIRITADGTATPFKVEDRVFMSKMNLYPISYNSALKAPVTGQTKGWE